MKRHTFSIVMVFSLLCVTATVHGQGFTGPRDDPPSPPSPGHNPPPPPPGPGHNPPPPPVPGHNPPPPPPVPGHNPPPPPVPGHNPPPPPMPGHNPPPPPSPGHNPPLPPVMTGEPMPISEAWNLPKDSWVIVSGNLVNTLPGGKYYTFRDFSGEITVEIEPKVWRGLSVGPSDKVMIGGEIEVKKGQVSIEVKTISGSGRMSNWHGQAVTVIQPITVGEAKNLPHDSWVILTGNIVNSLGRERYTFRDYSGEITVEIEPKVWRGLSAGVSDMVEIQGELDTKRGQFSIEVKAIRKI